MRENNNILADAYQAVQITIPGVASTGQTGTTFQFPDLPYLRPRQAYIQAIEVYTLASVSLSPVSGTALASLGIMQKTALTLYGGIDGVKQGNQIVQQIPVLRLNNLQNATPDPFAVNIMKFNNLEVDWTKSFITIGSAPANTSDVAVVFGVYFNFSNKSLMNDF